MLVAKVVTNDVIKMESDHEVEIFWLCSRIVRRTFSASSAVLRTASKGACTVRVYSLAVLT